MALVATVVAEIFVVLTEGSVGDYQQALNTTSDVLKAGQTSNHMLQNIAQMITTAQEQLT